ncbi:hypothetical protein TA3x_004821 [Tundrisphaera sp. TA3]|uniref:hypothetical protein n=1 Tax=Tundrisphaera sp. TA3 TaxID=3435775 RepID=UPI003EBFE1C1
MPLTHLSCTHCGFWHTWFERQDPMTLNCVLCSDVRNALPPDGWDYADAARVAGTVRTQWKEFTPGIWGFWCEPRYGLAGTGWLILRDDGNVAFEGAPFYHDDALEQIERLGGIRVLGASHPHGYGALWQLQERFRPELVIHREDVRYTKAFHVSTVADDRHEVAPGLTLHHVGGHYEGQCVLHDQGRRALFVGDSLKFDDFDADGRVHALSCHKGYHYHIPLSKGELAHYRRVYEQLPFDRAFTPFEFAPNVGRDDALALFDRLIAGRPTTEPLPMETAAHG